VSCTAFNAKGRINARAFMDTLRSRCSVQVAWNRAC